MPGFTRRQILQSATVAPLAAWTWNLGARHAESHPSAADLKVATFRFDVTPPLGHSCCGGWIKPVEVVDDSLEAVGLILLGAGKPIVICSVDWTGLLNSAHRQWREALASAAGTTPERVAVHCVHQHNAPFACLDAQKIVAQYPELPGIVDPEFFAKCLQRGAAAVRASLAEAQPLTHVAASQAKVEKVASNRRVARDATGRITKMRGSSCQDEELRALPEGLIDPWLKSVALYSGNQKLAVCHYYATHPMSYYADGRVSSDFAGLARKRLQEAQPDCCHLYFTGCAGNIAAGKYNDGAHATRPILTERVYEAMAQADAALEPAPLEHLTWLTQDLIPQPRESFHAEALEQQIADPNQSVVNRNRPAYTLAWLRRVQQQTPIILSCLRLNQISLLHLPAECFIEYQLHAQQTAGDSFVATAAYGDGGPWYIPTEEEYSCGGYEVSVAFCAATIERMLQQGIARLLAT